MAAVSFLLRFSYSDCKGVYEEASLSLGAFQLGLVAIEHGRLPISFPISLAPMLVSPPTFFGYCPDFGRSRI